MSPRWLRAPAAARVPDRTDDEFNEAFGVDFDAAGGGPPAPPPLHERLRPRVTQVRPLDPEDLDF
jgi:hypothetical protein